MQRFLALAVAVVLGTGSAGAQSLQDNFDGRALDKTKWAIKQIREDQISFPTEGRCGAGIEITVRERDGAVQCDTDCQRAELRTVRSSWPAFGDEVWYRFSFRVGGDIAEIGSQRFVVGQWKGPGDISPMIAQRFDNGVFHITVQDNDVRYVVASAEGDPDATVQRELAKAERIVEERPAERKPDRVDGDTGMRIIPGKNAMLPDPRKGWVDMTYRIKPGRTDNEYGPRRPGELDVWANGSKIVSVRGNIGATLKTEHALPLTGPYFKFGIYRLRQPGTVRFGFDEFSQAPNSGLLADLCKAR